MPGNDGSWGQIERDQASMLGCDTACVLNRDTQYHLAAQGYGAVGLLIGAHATEGEIEDTLRQAQVCKQQMTGIPA